MSINTDAYLPGNVRIRDVTMVMARLLGVELLEETYSLRLPEGCDYETTNSAELSIIRIGSEFSCWWHWEQSSYPGMRLVSMRASIRSVEIANRLVDFFGGFTVATDANEKITYKRKPKSDRLNHPVATAPYNNLQKRIKNVEAIRVLN